MTPFNTEFRQVTPGNAYNSLSPSLSTPVSISESTKLIPAIQTTPPSKIIKSSRSSPDRFIPTGHSVSTFRMRSPGPKKVSADNDNGSPKSSKITSETHESRIAEALGFDRSSNVFIYQKPCSSRCKAGDEQLDSFLNFSASKAIPKRPVSMQPIKVLDAPNLRDDFYTTLLAWSSKGDLAVGLADNVYLWNNTDGTTQVPEDFSDQFVSSLAFSYHGDILAIGRVDGMVQFWSKGEYAPRLELAHAGDIGCMTWRPKHPLRSKSKNDLLVGAHNGKIYYYEIEWTNSSANARLLKIISNAHQEQICGLAWNIDGTQFATGGNDNFVCLFDALRLEKPKIVWQHFAAVKALAFCPWQKSLLATGGGSHDKRIRFYHTHTGALINMIDCGGQVTSLTWSPTYREICATFGYSFSDISHRIAVYAWPTLKLLVSIPAGHPELRAIYAVNTVGKNENGENVGGGTIVVAASDETVRFYKMWEDERGSIASGGGGRAVRWEGVFGSDIVELVEGIDREGNEKIR